MIEREFEEIGHSGGKVTFTIATDGEGRTSFQIDFSTSRPVPSAIVGVYALPSGIPVGSIELGGIGQPWNPPPHPDCLPVLIASDSREKFGHTCPRCKGYWRSGPYPNCCPYCRLKAPSFQFLSEAQLRYVRHYCDVLTEGLATAANADLVIDMDEVADAVGKDSEKPAFYVSEESQQCKFSCAACGAYNDVLGRFAYCSVCGTRNDLADFEASTAPEIRDRLGTGDKPEDCVRDAVAAFDSFMAQVAKELANKVPLTQRRKDRLLKRRFHNPEELKEVLSNWFDIDVQAGIKDDDWRFILRMFLRRHVYEHNGGEVDQKYIDASGDTTVRLKQHIRETQEDAHKLLGQLVRMVRNIHGGFHELFPPNPEPINAFKEKQARTQGAK